MEDEAREEVQAAADFVPVDDGGVREYDADASSIGSRFSLAFHALLIRVTTVIADIAA